MTDDTTIESLKTHLTPLDLRDTMAEAGRKVLLGDFIKMLENEAGSRTGEDIEHVHDMRVATRRMRSAFRLLDDHYKTKPVRPLTNGLKQVARQLGQVRDLDVMIDDLQTHQATLEDEANKDALQHVIDKLDKRRSKARRKLNNFLDSDAYNTFVAAFGAFLTAPGKSAKAIEDDSVPHQVRHVLPGLIHEHLALVRAYDNVLEGADFETLHALRIEFKRLRYIVDYFDGVLGASANDFLKELKVIQDYLGRMNDTVVAEERLREIIEDGVKKPQKKVLRAYIDLLEADRQRLDAEFPAVWEHFNTRTVQSKLMNALLTLR